MCVHSAKLASEKSPGDTAGHTWHVQHSLLKWGACTENNEGTGCRQCTSTHVCGHNGPWSSLDATSSQLPPTRVGRPYSSSSGQCLNYAGILFIYLFIKGGNWDGQAVCVWGGRWAQPERNKLTQHQQRKAHRRGLFVVKFSLRQRI